MDPLEKKKKDDEDRALLESLAQKIVDKRLETPVVFCLEASRPLSFIASQAMIFLGPLVQALYPVKDYKRFANLLGDRKNIECLIREIESRAGARE